MFSRRNRIRRTTLAIAVSTALLTLAACSEGDAGSQGDAGSEQTAAQADRPTEATGTVNVRIAGGLTSTDPFREIGITAWQMLRQVYEGLISLDNELQPIPMLAESWTVSDDGKTYTFTLRSGVKFHDGTEMTSEDVVYSLSYYKENALRGETNLGVVENIEADGPETVRITLTEPRGSFLVMLGNPVAVPIVPTDSAENDGLVNDPIGTGPFMVENFQNENRAVLTAFDDYQPVEGESSIFGGHKEPLVEKVVIHSVPDDQTAIAGLQTGEYGILDGVPTNQLERISALPEINVQNVTGASTHVLYMNTGDDGVPDPKVRAAILAAIDKQHLLDTTWSGLGEVTHSYMPPEATWYRPEAAEHWPWDGGIEQAKELLAESSYDGEPIEIMVSSFDYMQQNAVLIQQKLEQAGMPSTIRQLDHTSYGTDLNQGNFEIATSGRPADIPADMTYVQWYCDHGALDQRFGYCDEEYDNKYEAAIQMTDLAEQADAFAELEMILKDEALTGPLYYTNFVVGVRDNVHGFEVNPYGWLTLWNVWVTE